MDERFEKDGEGGTERGRSPSGVPPSGVPGEELQGRAENTEGPGEGLVSPAPQLLISTSTAVVVNTRVSPRPGALNDGSALTE